MNAHSAHPMTGYPIADALAAATSPYLPPRHSERDRLADAWRLSLYTVDSSLLMIGIYSRTAATSDYARKAVERRLRSYASALRRVSEFQIEMDRLGIAFVRDQNAWPVEQRAA